MKTLSVVISVYNGEKYLEACLSSVKDVASEIIVVDHFSTDNSFAIAKKFTKKVYQRENDSRNIDIQKNFGLDKATKEWTLLLDADEKITPDLAQEISKILSEDTLEVAYAIPRKNIILGKWIEHTGWYPDYQIRLFKNGKGRFTKKHVHESISIEGSIGKCVSPLVHEAYQSIGQFLERGLLLYAPNEAEAKKESGYEFAYSDAIRMPFQEFLSRFFAREGYKDGFHGLVLSLLMACYHFAVFLYLWEDKKFPEKPHSLSLVTNEVISMQKEFDYWVTEVTLKETKNPAAKVFFKAKRKLGL